LGAPSGGQITKREKIMDRRQFGTGALLGALGLGAVPALASAQGMGGGAMGDAEKKHVTDTLQIGGVALMSSQLAQSKASNAKVKKFAGFEVEEQTGIKTILTEVSGMSPPPPPPADQAAMQKLQSASGAAFDRAYLAAQLDGHRRLLTVQETYLSQGRDPHHRHIAMLARGRILEHIQDVQDLQRMA
jgi:putative membrane protein